MSETDSKAVLLNALRTSYGIPKQGSILKYSDIEKLLGFKRYLVCKQPETFGVKIMHPKWFSVVRIWRYEIQNKYNLFSKAIRGHGIKFLTEPERIILSDRKYKQGITNITNARNISAGTDTTKLNKAHKFKQTHLMKLSDLILQIDATKGSRSQNRNKTSKSKKP